MKLVLFLALTIPWKSVALETDNYLLWGKELRDVSHYVDRFFRDGIESALEKITEHETKSCEAMTMLIARDFASFLVHDNPVENWLFTVLGPGEMYPQDIFYVEESIYQEPFRAYIPWFGLAPGIQVSNYYFGTDKLSHFASTGMDYYKIFRRELRKGRSAEVAEESAILWGIRDEKTLHGFWASGVFSYADLEANYQGLKFYRRFCEGDSPYLRKIDGRWKLVLAPRIEDYVSGYWDETFELSYRLPQNWEKVAPILREKYCALRNDPRITERHSYYRESPVSFSHERLNDLVAMGEVPKPQSFEALCSGQ